jgi:ERF superfamily
MISKSETIVRLQKALRDAKQDFTPILKEKENPGFKRDGKASRYADLGAVIEATEPALLKHGLLVTQFPHSEGNNVGVVTLIIHESGEFLEHGFTLPLGKQDAQAGVGAVTYARRCALKAALNVAEEDDDGQTASATSSVSRPNNPERTEAKKPPKAEIPNEPLGKSENKPKTGSATSKNSDSDPSLPDEKELDDYRDRFGKIIEALSTAGLKASKGFPLQKKAVAYLLQETGADAAEKVSKGAWNAFFENVNAIVGGEGGIKTLVELVNSAVEETK